MNVGKGAVGSEGRIWHSVRSWPVRIIRTVTFRSDAYAELMHDPSATWQSILTSLLVFAPHQIIEFFDYESRYFDILIRAILSGPVGLVVWTGVVFLFLGSSRQRVGYFPLLRGLGFSAVGLGIAGLANFGIPDASVFKSAAPYLWLLPVAMQVQAVTQMSRASDPAAAETPDSAATTPTTSPGQIRAAASVLVPVTLLAIAALILIIFALAMFGWS